VLRTRQFSRHTRPSYSRRLAEVSHNHLSYDACDRPYQRVAA
jgi:hypothetical protein